MKSKENTFFFKRKHTVITTEVMLKKWSGRHISCPYFTIFRANGKYKLIIPNMKVLVGMILQNMDKTVRYFRKTQFFIPGHVTLGLPLWLHLHSKHTDLI